MDQFDGDVIIRQLRSLQVLETVHLMAGGEPLLTNLTSMAIKNLAIKGADSFRNKQFIRFEMGIIFDRYSPQNEIQVIQ